MNSFSKEVSNFIKGMNFQTGMIITIILVLLLCAIILLSMTRKPRRFNLPLAIIGVCLAAFTLVCATYFTGSGIILIHTNGNPSDVVDSFYSALIADNYPAAYGYLKDYTTLGLENEPQDGYSDKIYEALKNSYAYELTGPAVINEFTAVQDVRFTYLDITSISDDIASRIDGLLEERVEQLPWHMIYDDNGDYRTDLLDEVYDTAFANAMKSSSQYIVTTDYSVSLEYIGDNWFIIVNDDMTYCLAGGTR